MKQKIHHNHKNIESKYQVTMREGKGFVLVFKGFLIALKLKITYTYASNVKPTS